MTNEEEFAELETEIGKISASLDKLYGKTNKNVTIGDQSYTLADIPQLELSRDKKRARCRELKRILSGNKARPSHKVTFRSC